jgi:hypothetical protein
LSSLIAELDQKTFPTLFIVVPDVRQRFARGGYQYQGFEKDVSTFVDILDNISRNKLSIEEWLGRILSLKRFESQKLRLKLLCEHCGKPAPQEEGYPITKPSADLVKLLPAMQVFPLAELFIAEIASKE